jgi:hypothetical protein
MGTDWMFETLRTSEEFRVAAIVAIGPDSDDLTCAKSSEFLSLMRGRPPSTPMVGMRSKSHTEERPPRGSLNYGPGSHTDSQ